MHHSGGADLLTNMLTAMLQLLIQRTHLCALFISPKTNRSTPTVPVLTVLSLLARQTQQAQAQLDVVLEGLGLVPRTS